MLQLELVQTHIIVVGASKWLSAPNCKWMHTVSKQKQAEELQIVALADNF